ncbi:MAG: NFACT family protein [Acidobacteria bacterium]|nr:NFACT family protein [Acidobacteriota bacterium]
MNLPTVTAICEELAVGLSGRKFGKIFQLSRFELAIDFRLSDSRLLFISIEPAGARIYFIKRRLRDIEKASQNLSAFFLLLRKFLSGADVRSIEQIGRERVLILEFDGTAETGESQRHFLAVQLTGRSANLFLLNDAKSVIASARESHSSGQQIGDVYAVPVRDLTAKISGAAKPAAVPSLQGSEKSLSEALDRFYQEKEQRRAFESLAAAARAKIKQELTKREKLITRLREDLISHGEGERWKKFGDLLLANVATAERDSNSIHVTDFFDTQLPTIAIAAQKEESITEAAEKYFKRYTKARNAEIEISKRISQIQGEAGETQRPSRRKTIYLVGRL